VISHRSKKFNRLLELLPAHIQTLTAKNYRLWRHDPWHPSLNFEEWQPGFWSVRVGAHHRALGYREGNTIVWYWIGTHEAYNKRLQQQR